MGVYFQSQIITLFNNVDILGFIYYEAINVITTVIVLETWAFNSSLEVILVLS